jgi:hypothetical protein
MKTYLLLCSLFSFSSMAQLIPGDIDTIPHKVEEFKIMKGTDFFRADDIEATNVRSNAISLQLKIRKNDQLSDITPLQFKLLSSNTPQMLNSNGILSNFKSCETNPNEKFRVSYIFDNKYFQVAYRKTYELIFTINCGEKTILIFDFDSTGGQVLGIVDIAETAMNKLKDNKLLSFWKKKIKIKWPANGDYYSYNTVNVTKGYQWDVVGHELGHAIYDQANIGSFGGGSHRIDQCYSEALALSEGWASLFGAWIKVSLSDPDAKFEYMVPRRAPLRFETIPPDVCSSHKNEWRVTGFLWDLIDLNGDERDSSSMNFIKFWKSGENKNYRSAKKLAKGYIKQGFDPILMNVIWKQNFLTEIDR